MRAARARTGDQVEQPERPVGGSAPMSGSRCTSTWPRIPDEKGYWVCNTVWMLDDFTPENGATRMVPGSHRWGRRPQDVLDDPMAPHPDEVLLTGKAGSVAVMNAHMWHGGTANRTRRRASPCTRSTAGGTSRSSSIRSSCCARRCRPACPPTSASSWRSTIR